MKKSNSLLVALFTLAFISVQSASADKGSGPAYEFEVKPVKKESFDLKNFSTTERLDAARKTIHQTLLDLAVPALLTGELKNVAAKEPNLLSKLQQIFHIDNVVLTGEKLKTGEGWSYLSTFLNFVASEKERAEAVLKNLDNGSLYEGETEISYAVISQNSFHHYAFATGNVRLHFGGQVISFDEKAYLDRVQKNATAGLLSGKVDMNTLEVYFDFSTLDPRKVSSKVDTKYLSDKGTGRYSRKVTVFDNDKNAFLVAY